MWAEFMKETFLTWASAGKIACVGFGELWPARQWCFVPVAELGSKILG